MAFAVREEHGLAHSLLRGPRTLVVLSGLLAVGAALALAGFQPLGLDLHAWWATLAAAAGVVTAALALSWLSAGSPIRREEQTTNILVPYGGERSS